MQKALIIINPHSGDGSASVVGQKLTKILLDKQIEVQIYETTGKDNFRQMIQEEMTTGLDTVIVLGGDGTLSEVVNGIAPLEKRPKVLPLPLGTTNNFTQALVLNQDPVQLLKAVERKQLAEKKVDIGQLNGDYFISSVSAGSLPEVAWQTDDDLKEKLGSLAYIVEGTKILSDFYPFTVKIKTEKSTYRLDEVFFLVVGLTNSIFGIPSFFSEATFDDGKLHLFALKKSNLFTEAGSVLKQILLNDEKKEGDDEQTLVTSFKKGVIHSSGDFHAAVDGEKGPKFPLKLGVLNEHITFLLPQTSK